MTNTNLGPRQQAFLDALRSGRYRQGKGLLRGPDDRGRQCYCAGGVLADLSGLGEWDGVGFHLHDPSFEGGNHDSVISVPMDVQDYFGMDLIGCNRIMDLNDSALLSFREIADRIEAKPSLFFHRVV